MDFDTFDTDLFSEINDTQAEIYDIIEYNEDGKDDDNKFDVEGYINGNTDYWENVTQVSCPWTVKVVAHKIGTALKMPYCTFRSNNETKHA